MQNSQEINWLAILAPSLITGLFMIGVQILIAYKLWGKMKDYENSLSADLKSYESSLSRRLEDYKKDISKELYEFQTRFSVLHNEKAKVIKELYSDFWDIFVLAENINLNFEREEKLEKLKQKRLETLIYFSKNRIFFDDEMDDKLEKFMGEIHTVTLALGDKDTNKNEDKYEKFRNFAKEELLVRLKKDFRQLLSAENPNNQLEKKQ